LHFEGEISDPVEKRESVQVVDISGASAQARSERPEFRQPLPATSPPIHGFLNDTTFHSDFAITTLGRLVPGRERPNAWPGQRRAGAIAGTCTRRIFKGPDLQEFFADQRRF